MRSFRSAFGEAEPAYFIRAPGRINLIGEHTDYNGFPVMPFAISRAIYAAVAPRDDKLVKLQNLQGEEYGPREFCIEKSIPPHPQGDWANYFKASVQGLLDRFQGQQSHLRDLRGFSCLVDGNIPPAAGLSSSSALVIAGALAFCAVNDIEMPRPYLATLLAEAEQYVGTRGGGMDQAICLMAKETHVLKIDFFPLRISPAPFPRDHCILAAHSTVPAAKTENQMEAYNQRVLECTLGTALLARLTRNGNAERLADLVDEAAGRGPSELSHELADLLSGQDTVTVRQIARLWNLEVSDFRKWLQSKTAIDAIPAPSQKLKVLPRCRHVFSEARRVQQALNSLRAGDIEALGRLMNQSHRSCAQDYEISCKELDELVALMREAGAAGARLTGAGFGGFAIGLVRKSAVSAVRESLNMDFYQVRNGSADDYVFEFTPQEGASVTELDRP